MGILKHSLKKYQGLILHSLTIKSLVSFVRFGSNGSTPDNAGLINAKWK